MPTLLDETLQAIWAVCIHPGPFTLNGHLDNNLQVSNSCCTLTSSGVRMVRFSLCSHGDYAQMMQSLPQSTILWQNCNSLMAC